MTRRGTGIFICFILLQSVIYGIGNPLTKVAYESITPLWLLAVRYGMALVLLALLFGRRIVVCLRRTDWRLWLPSGFCCAGAFVAINIALSLTEATSVGFLMSLSVLFAPILSAVYLRRPYDRRSLPIQLVLVVGLFLLCCNGGAFSFGAGEALSLFAALCLAGILVFGERAMTEMDAVSFTAPQMAITFVVSLVGALLFEPTTGLTGSQPEAWLVAVYLAVVCSVGGNLLQNSAVLHLSASTVSMLQCTQPILTAAASFFMLGEVLSGLGFVGAVVIVAGLLLDGWLHRDRSGDDAPAASQ